MTVLTQAPQRRRRTDASAPLFLAAATLHHGERTATVQLAGELCAFTAPTLATMLDGLVTDDIAAVTIDLSRLELCTSQGLELFLRLDRRLRARGGALTLRGAHGVVRRVLDIVLIPHEP